jgi:hypothetical protein
VNSDKVDSGQKYSDASNIPYIFHKKQQFLKNISSGVLPEEVRIHDSLSGV